MKNKKIKQKTLTLVTMILTSVLLIGLSACSTGAKKPDAPIEKIPEGKVPHVPGLTNAQVKVLWVPEKIEQDSWEDGHFKYIIDHPSSWSVK